MRSCFFSCVYLQVVYDRDTGRSRGFGFVTMNSAEDAQAAIERFDGSVSFSRDLFFSFVKPAMK